MVTKMSAEDLMRKDTTAFKRLRCEVCNGNGLTSVARIGDDEFALALPPGWRVVWSKDERKLRFWCDTCWETFELTLEADATLP